jgi:hypothetical protein
VSPVLQRVSFSGAMLARGFWLYVWEVISADGCPVLYVGMTGDTGSANAQSPFNRLSQHLGSNEKANALRRQLLKVGIEPTTCRSLEMVAYGPIFPEAASTADHPPCRNLVAAMEKAVRDALHNAGYTVLNDVNCRQKLDDRHWQQVLAAFSERFTKLNPAPERRREEHELPVGGFRLGQDS